LPPGLDSDKKYCCISSSYYTTITLFLTTRSVLWPRGYRKCICDRGFALDPLGSSRRPKPPSRLGRGHPSPDSARPTQRRRLDPRASGARVCLIHIISGYTTDRHSSSSTPDLEIRGCKSNG